MFRQHWLLIVILGLFLCLATTFSCLLPLGEAADETDHFALVRFIAEHGRPPLTVAERNAIGPKGDASPIYHALVALLTQHVDTRALPTLPDTQANPRRLISTDGFKANRIFHTEDELFPWRGIVLAWHLARLISVALGAATVVAAYLTVLSTYPQRRSLAIAAAAFVAFLPRFIINSAVVSDDAMVVPLVACSVYVMVRIAQGAQHPRTFLLLGILMGLAAITKYHSLVLLPEATLLCIVLAWRSALRSANPRQVWLAWLHRWGWAVVAFTLTAGWWFAFLIVRFNQVAELGWVRGLIAPLGDPVFTTGLSHLFEMPGVGNSGYPFGWNDWASLLFRSFWLTYGWLHVFAPTWVYLALGVWTLLATTGLGVQLVKCSLTSAGRRIRLLSPSTWRWDIILLVLHFLIYLGIVMMRQASRPARETAQGRHLYPALTAIAFLSTYGLSALPCSAHDLVNSLRSRFADRHGRQNPPAEERVRVGKTLWLFSLPAGLLALSLVALPGVILPVYLPYLPIRTLASEEAVIEHRLKVSFARGLTLVGYDIPALSGRDNPSFEVDTGIPITLYWYAKQPQTRDYLVRLCLENAQGEKVLCVHRHPLDGRYPVRAWEAGHLIRDETILPTPACLPEGLYALSLEMLPLRLDSAVSTVDTALSRHELVTLGQVSLRASGYRGVPPPRMQLWTAQGLLRQNTLQIQQLRQSFTVFVRRSADGQDDGSPLWLAARDDPARRWLPVSSQEVCQPSEGEAITAHSFIADASVRPGEYLFQAPDGSEAGLSVQVATRWRAFELPTHLATHRETTVVGCDESLEPCIELVSYELERSPHWPGESIPITVHWRARRTMSQSYVVVLYLLDNIARVGGQLSWSLGGHYSNMLWAPGEYVPETYQLPVFLGTPPGLYTIQLSLYGYRTDAKGDTHIRLPIITSSTETPTDSLYLGQVRVKDMDEGSPPSHALRALLGDQIQLLGYDLSPSPDGLLSPGQTLNLILYWQAVQQPAEDYTVFTQLIGPDGLVWGQQDNQPQGGRYPTSQWTAGQPVVDRYIITLQPDAPSGRYRLLTGMYLLASGRRLPAIAGDGTPLPDNAIPLVELYVK